MMTLNNITILFLGCDTM